MYRKIISIATLFVLVTTALAVTERRMETSAFAVPLQGRKYVVPGGAGGPEWLDTGLDVRAGEKVHLFAEGEVAYGANVGTLGPAGKEASGVSGLPAETTYRYGLVARVTASRTNPQDDLRADYAYGETEEFCVRAGGRLWLTVNDSDKNDNKGEYTVVIELGACDRNPTPQPTPDPGHGSFRVKIIGFNVEHVVHDGVLDAGDDAYILWDTAEINADGRVVGTAAGKSLVYGDSERGRTRVQAGTQGPNGGLKAGDEIKGTVDQPASERLPLKVGDFKLAARANAIIFCPTIWVANDEPGDYPRLYRHRVQSRARFAAYDVRDYLQRNASRFHWVYSLTRGSDDWFEMLLSGSAARNKDRPIGVSSSLQLGLQNIDGTPSTLVLDFVPHTFLLTYQSVSDLFRSAGGQREIRFEARYRDSGPRGAYTILMTIERLP
ncbi:MAG TPA: hypothetical protein VFZ40_18685 [Pyrinomonadaceae bacterium]